MSKLIEMGKRYRCANGWEAEVLSIDMGDEAPVLARVRKQPDDAWILTWRSADGKTPATCVVVSDFDLIEVPEKVSVDFWVVINKESGDISNAFRTKERAVKHGGFLGNKHLVHVSGEFEVEGVE
jgi:hypothetical protein